MFKFKYQRSNNPTNARTMITKAFNTNFTKLSAKQTSQTTQLNNNTDTGKTLDSSIVAMTNKAVAQTK